VVDRKFFHLFNFIQLNLFYFPFLIPYSIVVNHMINFFSLKNILRVLEIIQLFHKIFLFIVGRINNYWIILPIRITGKNRVHVKKRSCFLQIFIHRLNSLKKNLSIVDIINFKVTLKVKNFSAVVIHMNHFTNLLSIK
jgi:hypothetical protein